MCTYLVNYSNSQLFQPGAHIELFHIYTVNMKFTSAALLFASIFDASAFAPSPALSLVTRTVVNPELFKFTPCARPSSELNLFGPPWRETRRINSLAKVKGTRITEKEVRALFEVWNSALATGDSRIVASRYTKVMHFRVFFIPNLFVLPPHVLIFLNVSRI